jgi:hypothetical protein
MCQCAGMSDPDLRVLLSTLDPKARGDLRRVLIRNQADRDAIASQLLRSRKSEATTGPTSSTCSRGTRRNGVE